MKNNFKELIFALIVFYVLLGCIDYLSAQENAPDDALLLAKSLWGEAGVDCFKTDEALIITYVYIKRSEITGASFRNIIKAYSGATKKRKDHKQKWLHHLNRAGDKPKKWDNKLSWKKNKPRWLLLLAWCDATLADLPPDPQPNITDYCGRFEIHQAPKYLKMVELGLKNAFFKRRKYKT